MIEHFARLLVLLLLLAPLGCAQRSTSPGQSSQGLSAVPSQDPKQELVSIVEQWAAAYTKGDLNGLMSLYDKDALVWGTSSSSMRKGSSAIREYYAQLLKAFPGTRVSIKEVNVRVHGESAVSSGLYTVQPVSSEGAARVMPARFTVTYVRYRGKWLIVDHHSSLATR